MANSEIDYNEVGYVLSSNYRTAVVAELTNGFATPTELADSAELDIDYGLPHISRALQELLEKDIVELLVDEDKKKGRLYALTEKGENIHEAIEER